MSIKALSDYTIYAKYARYLKDKQRRETWEEQVERVFEMHERKFADALIKFPEFRTEFEFAKKQVIKKRVLGSQRSLQFGGKSIEKHNAKMFNCSFGYIDRAVAFQEMMYLLLCGVGVGFSVQTKHVSKLPNLHTTPSHIVKSKKTFVIPDSIEGWADAIGILVTSYFKQNGLFSEYNNCHVEFDYSEIRPAGSLIDGGFKAPGPEGLKNSIEKIRKLINDCIDAGNKQLRSIDAYDIVMHMSDAVLSGGVRRSATICLFSVDDDLMMNAKTGAWFEQNPQRGRSNNSALLVRNKTTREQFAKLMKSTKEFGEPGFIWAEDEDIGFNPCLDGDTLVSTDKGEIPLRDIVSNVNDYKVLSYCEDTNSFEYQVVTSGTKTRENSDCILIEFDDDTHLEVTPDHKIFTNNRGYVKASDLNEDDEIVCGDTVSEKYDGSKPIEVTERGYIDQSQWRGVVFKEEN
jgi:ribonucleoside-diphosphate reductase alpha chain